VYTNVVVDVKSWERPLRATNIHAAAGTYADCVGNAGASDSNDGDAAAEYVARHREEKKQQQPAQSSERKKAEVRERLRVSSSEAVGSARRSVVSGHTSEDAPSMKRRTTTASRTMTASEEPSSTVSVSVSVSTTAASSSSSPSPARPTVHANVVRSADAGPTYIQIDDNDIDYAANSSNEDEERPAHANAPTSPSLGRPHGSVFPDREDVNRFMELSTLPKALAKAHLRRFMTYTEAVEKYLDNDVTPDVVVYWDRHMDQAPPPRQQQQQRAAAAVAAAAPLPPPPPQQQQQPPIAAAAAQQAPAASINRPSCPICANEYDANEFRPCLSKCGHKFCIACAQKMSNSEEPLEPDGAKVTFDSGMSCPMCRRFIWKCYLIFE